MPAASGGTAAGAAAAHAGRGGVLLRVSIGAGPAGRLAFLQPVGHLRRLERGARFHAQPNARPNAPPNAPSGLDGSSSPQQDPPMDTSALSVIGLTCCVVGVFFLANSIRFREPRKALAESLESVEKSLDKVRDLALNTMQVIIGFLFLTTGFLLQIVGRWDSEFLTLAACAGIILFAAAVYAIGAYSSKRAFKKLVREFFQARPHWNFSEDMALTK